MTDTTADSHDWHIVAAQAAEDKIATNTIIIDVGDVIGITEFFVISSGANTRQVRAIVESVEEEITRLYGPKPIRIEGMDSAQWVLMDFGSFVVHVFTTEVREYYELERLWGDRPRVAWQTATNK